jgi:hypothetical protein
MAAQNHLELRVENYYGNPQLPTVCSILYIDRRRFILEWMMGKDGLLWTINTVEKRDIKRFIKKWRNLAGNFRMPLILHRSTSNFLA